jgi:hypothetical protein
MNQTGEEINRNAADYANNAALLNVVRASLSEPLTFVAITGPDGTDPASGTIGLPGLTFYRLQLGKIFDPRLVT